MKVNTEQVLSDSHLDAQSTTNQRQLSIAIAAVPEQVDQNLPLNLCLVLDRSGSMRGRPLENIKEAAINLLEKLTPRDRLSVVTFNHEPRVLIPNQFVTDIVKIKNKIKQLRADGGTAIDEGMKLGIKQLADGKQDTVSQIFLLTDGENEHGNNERCLKLALLASEYNITLNTLGFGNHWNQDVLEQISDSANGSLSYIEAPEQAVDQFGRLFTRMQSVGLINAYLNLELMPQVRLAELKPVAQVAPETIELPIKEEGGVFTVRLGDLIINTPRIVLANLYISKLPPGTHPIAKVQIRYDDPAHSQQNLLSEKMSVEVEVQEIYQANPVESVQKSILTLAKYRQTKIAETKLEQGDRLGAASMFESAANTALQLGDKSAATVLQVSATRLQSGEELSEAERKKTRIVSKTTLQ